MADDLFDGFLHVHLMHFGSQAILEVNIDRIWSVAVLGVDFHAFSEEVAEDVVHSGFEKENRIDYSMASLNQSADGD